MYKIGKLARCCICENKGRSLSHTNCYIYLQLYIPTYEQVIYGYAINQSA